MASGARRDLHAYSLADLPARKRHVVLTPAVRWRVVVEEVKEIENDVILDAVLRIRAAGETSPIRIADLLQLPEDLVRHLITQAATARMRVTSDGRLQAGESKVAWIYRDIATGELWPDPAEEVPPLPLRFGSRYRARFDRGTAGRPITVECLLMDTKKTAPAEPTSVELARFSRVSTGHNRRTAVVSSGELCLVASPVVGLVVGHAIETTRGVPHLSLSQLLANLGRDTEAVGRWLADVPKSAAAKASDLPLRQAVLELRDVVGDRAPNGRWADTEAVLSRVELCLSRFVDQFQYHYGVTSDPAEFDADAAAVLGQRAGLSPDLARVVARSERGTAPYKVIRLLLADPPPEPQMLNELVQIAAHFTAIALRPDLSPTLDRLVAKTIDVCDRLIAASEGMDVKQAG